MRRVEPSMTAKIDQGVITNRVRVKKRATKSASLSIATNAPPANVMQGENWGRPYRVISISCYVDDLAEIDAYARAARMSRSDYLRSCALKVGRDART